METLVLVRNDNVSWTNSSLGALQHLTLNCPIPDPGSPRHMAYPVMETYGLVSLLKFVYILRQHVDDVAVMLETVLLVKVFQLTTNWDAVPNLESLDIGMSLRCSLAVVLLVRPGWGNFFYISSIPVSWLNPLNSLNTTVQLDIMALVMLRRSG